MLAEHGLFGAMAMEACRLSPAQENCSLFLGICRAIQKIVLTQPQTTGQRLLRILYQGMQTQRITG
jgi:hypothetical protein